MNSIVAEKIQDFFDTGIPEVFERDLDLGAVQPPARGNLAIVVAGVRRCGKTYRLYQEMHRIVQAGYSFDNILYFNFKDERLRPYDSQLLSKVLDTFYAMRPQAKTEGAFLFFDEIQEVPEWGAFLRRVIDTQKSDNVRYRFLVQNVVNRLGKRVSRTFANSRAVPHELWGICAFSRRTGKRHRRRRVHCVWQHVVRPVAKPLARVP